MVRIKESVKSWRRQEANEPMKKRKVGLNENRMFKVILLAYLCKNVCVCECMPIKKIQRETNLTSFCY